MRSKAGRVLVVKGDTHKEKSLRTEHSERDDGSIAETRKPRGESGLFGRQVLAISVIARAVSHAFDTRG